MKIQTYNEIDIFVISKSPFGSQAMQLACDVTQKKFDIGETMKSLSPRLAKYLIDADHTSVFEHASMTILASGISRSLLAQVTRQRHFSFTSASQHYQDYRDYPMVLRPGYKEGKGQSLYEAALEAALWHYIKLIELGEKPEEARQVLPNACAVNLVITANPRALAEFLTVRMCQRNTLEMQIFAEKLHKVCVDWLPEIFEHIGPHCSMYAECNQGKMSCMK